MFSLKSTEMWYVLFSLNWNDVSFFFVLLALRSFENTHINTNAGTQRGHARTQRYLGKHKFCIGVRTSESEMCGTGEIVHE